MRAAPRLVPVGARKPNQLAEARLRQAWRFVMGPALADRTRLLRVEREVLVIGCWELTRIAALREAGVQLELAADERGEASTVRLLEGDRAAGEDAAETTQRDSRRPGIRCRRRVDQQNVLDARV